MRDRRHHNNTGLRQIHRGKTRDQVERIAKRLGIPYAFEADGPTSEASAARGDAVEAQAVGGQVDRDAQAEVGTDRLDAGEAAPLPAARALAVSQCDSPNVANRFGTRRLLRRGLVSSHPKDGEKE